jgi:streptogramin lyase
MLKPKKFAGLAAIVLGALAGPAAAQGITEFPLPGLAGGTPGNLVVNPDGALWFPEPNLGRIVEITTGGQVLPGTMLTSGGMPSNLFGADSNQIWFTDAARNAIGFLQLSSEAVTEFTAPTADSGPNFLVRGAEGNMWFVEAAANKIGTATASQGILAEYPVPTPSSGLIGLLRGPDNNLWFAETTANKIGRITTGGTITEFPVPTANAGVAVLLDSYDGAIWFSEPGPGQIGRITTDGVITEFPITTRSGAPDGLANGADRNIWFVEKSANKIGAMTTSGAMIGEFPIPTAASGATGLLAGRDLALWFAEPNTAKLGRITVDGAITEFPTPTPNSGPHGLALGSDGAIWFAENVNQIGRAVPFSNGVALQAAVLPAARAVVQGEPATYFASIVNGGSTAGTSCAIGLNAPLHPLHYQTTDPATNALTGSLDTPVDIPAGGSQSFLISVTSEATISSTLFLPGYFCANANPAPAISELNSLVLTVSSSPTPDVIAIAATESGDGIVDLPGPSGVNAFAVATSNVGAGGTILAVPEVNNTELSLPISLSICQTDSQTGACLATPAASVTVPVASGQTPTFSVFIAGQGNVPFDPANNRIVVFFFDGGVNVGAASVAVRTR